MNTRSATLLVTFALALAAQAETAVTLKSVHLCCKSCVTGAEKAVAKVNGATATVDADAETVVIKAADAATAQKAVDSLVDAGYFGESEDATVKVKDNSGAKEGNVPMLAVNDVHLCCKKCVTAADKAVSSVKGVTGNTAVKGAKTFEVKGDFSPKEIFAALQKEGLTGKAGK
jgi:copper chaperone CopZ